MHPVASRTAGPVSDHSLSAEPALPSVIGGAIGVFVGWRRVSGGSLHLAIHRQMTIVDLENQ